jgi:hypothetical protein
VRLWIGLCFQGAALFLSVTTASTEEVIMFLQDGRTNQAEKTEIVGNKIRIETPTGIFQIPRSDVLSIYPVILPRVSPSTPPPADVYRDLTPQMTNKVRREIRRRGLPGGSSSWCPKAMGITCEVNPDHATG